MAIFLSASDPIEDDPRVLLDREEEEAREQRWAEFTAFVRQARASVLLRYVIDHLEDRPDWHLEAQGVYRELTNFAETERWSGVLTVIAKVLKEQGS